MRTYAYHSNGKLIAQQDFKSLNEAEAYGAKINADEIIIKHNENNQNQKSNPS